MNVANVLTTEGNKGQPYKCLLDHNSTLSETAQPVVANVGSCSQGCNWGGKAGHVSQMLCKVLTKMTK